MEPSQNIAVYVDLENVAIGVRDARFKTFDIDVVFRRLVDKGNILVTGNVDEIKNSDNERIQNLLHRRFEEEVLDPEQYLARLTGEEFRD